MFREHSVITTQQDDSDSSHTNSPLSSPTATADDVLAFSDLPQSQTCMLEDDYNGGESKQGDYSVSSQAGVALQAMPPPPAIRFGGNPATYPNAMPRHWFNLEDKDTSPQRRRSVFKGNYAEFKKSMSNLGNNEVLITNLDPEDVNIYSDPIIKQIPGELIFSAKISDGQKEISNIEFTNTVYQQLFGKSRKSFANDIDVFIQKAYAEEEESLLGVRETNPVFIEVLEENKRLRTLCEQKRRLTRSESDLVITRTKKSSKKDRHDATLAEYYRKIFNATVDFGWNPKLLSDVNACAKYAELASCVGYLDHGSRALSKMMVSLDDQFKFALEQLKNLVHQPDDSEIQHRALNALHHQIEMIAQKHANELDEDAKYLLIQILLWAKTRVDNLYKKNSFEDNYLILIDVLKEKKYIWSVSAISVMSHLLDKYQAHQSLILTELTNLNAKLTRSTIVLDVDSVCPAAAVKNDSVRPTRVVGKIKEFVLNQIDNRNKEGSAAFLSKYYALATDLLFYYPDGINLYKALVNGDDLLAYNDAKSKVSNQLDNSTTLTRLQRDSLWKISLLAVELSNSKHLNDHVLAAKLLFWSIQALEIHAAGLNEHYNQSVNGDFTADYEALIREVKKRKLKNAKHQQILDAMDSLASRDPVLSKVEQLISEISNRKRPDQVALKILNDIKEFQTDHPNFQEDPHFFEQNSDLEKIYAEMATAIVFHYPAARNLSETMMSADRQLDVAKAAFDEQLSDIPSHYDGFKQEAVQFRNDISKLDYKHPEDKLIFVQMMWWGKHQINHTLSPQTRNEQFRKDTDQLVNKIGNRPWGKMALYGMLTLASGAFMALSIATCGGASIAFMAAFAGYCAHTAAASGLVFGASFLYFFKNASKKCPEMDHLKQAENLIPTSLKARIGA